MSPIPPLLVGLFGIVAIILAAVFALYRHFFSYWKKRGLNYLEPIIPFGNALYACMGKFSFGEIFREWHIEIRNKGWKHGGVYFLGKPIYMPTDNDIIKRILVTDFWHFPNHGLYLSEKSDLLSVHIFNMENSRWKNVRAKLPAAFTAAKIREYVIVMEQISKVLIEKLDEYAASKKSVNIKEVLNRFSIDILCSCTLGMQSNTLNNGNEELVKQSRAFFDNQWSRTKSSIVFLIPRHILTFLRFKTFTTDTKKYFQNMFGGIKEYREKENINKNDLTQLLMNLCESTEEHRNFNGKGTMDPLNFNEFVGQLYIFFEAGFETSSSTQTFAMYELAVNQEVQKMLRDEIKKVLDRYNGKVCYDAVNEMEYLDRVVDETLRKYPVIPILPRKCVKDYRVPGTEVTIEKGTLVMVSNWAIHYDPDYYPDPMKFDPDRFTPENKAKRPYCSYLPFGEGPRICIGKRFGLWQTKIGLLSMVKNYKITLSKKMELPMTFAKPGLLLNIKGDVWVDLEKI